MNNNRTLIALIALFITVLVAFGGAMLRAGEIDFKVKSTVITVAKHADRLDLIEQSQARTDQRFIYIDESLKEIKVLLKERTVSNRNQ